MSISRRQFFKLNGAGLLASQLAACELGGNSPARLYGGYRGYGNTFGTACIDQSGELIWKLETPARLHEVCLSQDLSIGAAVARRPGYFIQLFSPLDGQELGQLDIPHGLIFEGHALFRNGPHTASGQTELWATASKADTSEAILLNYRLDIENSKVASESTSETTSKIEGQAKITAQAPEQISIPGLGPHQMLLLEHEHEQEQEQDRDQKQSKLVIAIGGWQSEGRIVLNPDSFESGLIFFDFESKTSDFVPMADANLSARHLSSDGQNLWVGMQLADPAPSHHSLLYRYSNQQGWTAVEEPESGWQGFNGYVGSVTVSENEVVATSPQGHIYGRWDLTGQSISTQNALDISGATSVNGKWWLSSGVGEVSRAGKILTSRVFWDNHWVGHT